MKKETKKMYFTPVMDVTEVVLEKGYAATDGRGKNPDKFRDGGELK